MEKQDSEHVKKEDKTLGSKLHGRKIVLKKVLNINKQTSVFLLKGIKGYSSLQVMTFLSPALEPAKNYFIVLAGALEYDYSTGGSFF